MYKISMNDGEALRAYVTAQDGKSQWSVHHEGVVRLEVTSDALMQGMMTNNNFQNFDIMTSIDKLKDKIHLTVGTTPVHMRLQLMSESGKLMAELNNDVALLGQYEPQDGWRIHVIDTDPFKTVAKFQNTESGPKYVMGDDEYQSRKGTFREWKLQNPDEYMKHFGHLHPSERGDEDGAKEAEKISVGARCRTAGDRRGTVRYVEKVTFSKGWWVGIELDEPLGKNNGSVKGKQYFECQDNYGVFAKAEDVEVGDFPSIFDEEMGDEDEI